MTEGKELINKGGAPEGNTNNLKHGVYGRQLTLLTEEKKREVVEMMSGTRAIAAPTDAIAVELLARNLAKIQLFDEWLCENGLITTDKDGNMIPQAVLKVYWQALNSATRLCTALGLTTEARLRLGLEVVRNEDALARIQQAKKK